MAAIEAEVALSELATQAPMIIENVVQGVSEVSKLLDKTGLSSYFKSSNENTPQIVAAATSNPDLEGPDMNLIKERISALERMAQTNIPGNDVVKKGEPVLVGMGPKAAPIEGKDENFVDILLETVGKDTFVEYTKNNMLDLMKSLLNSLHRVNKLTDIKDVTKDNLEKVSQKVIDEIASLKKTNANNVSTFYRFVLSAFGVDSFDINQMSPEQQARLVHSFITARTMEATVPSLKEYVGVLRIIQQLNYISSVFDVVSETPSAYTGMEEDNKSILQGVLKSLSSIIKKLVGKLSLAIQMDSSTSEIIQKIMTNGRTSEGFSLDDTDKLTIVDVLIRLGDIGGLVKSMNALAKKFSLGKEVLKTMIKNMRNGIDEVVANLPSDVMTDIVTNKPAFTLLKNITTAMQKRQGLIEKLQNEIEKGKGLNVTGGYSIMRERKDAVDIVSTLYRELVKKRNELVSKFWGFTQVNTMVLRESGLSETSLDAITAVIKSDNAPVKLDSSSDTAKTLFNYEGTDDIGAPIEPLKLFVTQFTEIILEESKKSEKAHKIFLEMKTVLDEILKFTIEGREKLAKLRIKVTSGKGYSSFTYGMGPAEGGDIEIPLSTQKYSKEGAISALNAAKMMARDRIEIKVEGEKENEYEEQVFRGIRQKLFEHNMEILKELDTVMPADAPDSHKILWNMIKGELTSAINSGHAIYSAIDILPKTLKEDPPMAKVLSHRDFQKLIAEVQQIPEDEGFRMGGLETSIYECIGNMIGEQWPVPRANLDDIVDLRKPLTTEQAEKFYNSMGSVTSSMYQITLFIKVIVKVSYAMYGINLFDKITQFNEAGLMEYASNCILGTCLVYLTGIDRLYQNPTTGLTATDDGSTRVDINNNNRWMLGGKVVLGNAIATASAPVANQQKIHQMVRETFVQNLEAIYLLFISPLISSLGVILPQLTPIGALASGRGKDEDKEDSSFKRRDARSGMFIVYAETCMIIMSWARVVAKANREAGDKKIRGLPVTMGDPIMRICATMFEMFTRYGAVDVNTNVEPTREFVEEMIYNINSWWDSNKNPTIDQLILELDGACKKQIILLSQDELDRLTADNRKLSQGYAKDRETVSGAILVNVDVKNEAGDAMPKLNVEFNDNKDAENRLARLLGEMIATSPEKATQELTEMLEFSQAEYEKKVTSHEKIDHILDVILVNTALTTGATNEERSVQINTCVFSSGDFMGNLIFGNSYPLLVDVFVRANFEKYHRLFAPGAFGNGGDTYVSTTINTLFSNVGNEGVGEFVSLVAPDITCIKTRYMRDAGRPALRRENRMGKLNPRQFMFNDTYTKFFPSANLVVDAEGTKTVCLIFKANTPPFRYLYPAFRILAYLSGENLANIKLDNVIPVEKRLNEADAFDPVCEIQPTGLVNMVEDVVKNIQAFIQSPGTKTTPELTNVFLDPEKLTQKLKGVTKNRTSAIIKERLENLINSHFELGLVQHKFKARVERDFYILDNTAEDFETHPFPGNSLLSVLIDDDSIPGMLNTFGVLETTSKRVPNLWLRAQNDPLYIFIVKLMKKMYPNMVQSDTTMDLRFFGRQNLPGGLYYTFNRALMNVARYTIDNDTMTIFRPLVRFVSEIVSKANIDASNSLDCYLSFRPNSNEKGTYIPEALCSQTTFEFINIIMELSSNSFKSTGYKNEESIAMYGPNAREMLIGAVNELRREIKMLTPTAEMVYKCLENPAITDQMFYVGLATSQGVATDKKMLLERLQVYIGSFAPLKAACSTLCDSILQLVSLPNNQFDGAISHAPRYEHLDTTGTPGMFTIVLQDAQEQLKQEKMLAKKNVLTTYRNYNTTTTFPKSFREMNTKWAHIDKYIIGSGVDLEGFLKLYMSLFTHSFNIFLDIHQMSYTQNEEFKYSNFFLRTENKDFKKKALFSTKTVPGYVASITSRRLKLTRDKLLDSNGLALSNKRGFFPFSKATFYRSIKTPILTMASYLFKQLIKLVEQYMFSDNRTAGEIAESVVELLSTPGLVVSEEAKKLYKSGITFSGMGIYTRTIANLIAIMTDANVGGAPYLQGPYAPAGAGVIFSVVVGNTMQKKAGQHGNGEKHGDEVPHVRSFAPFEMIFTCDMLASLAMNILIQLYNLESQISGKDPMGNIQTALTMKICNLITTED